MKKVLAIVLVAAMILGCLAGCGKKSDDPIKDYEVETEEETLKMGLICLHDSESSYDANFIEAFESACKENGVEGIIKTNVPETNECYEACVDLVDRECNVIFGDSFGFESFMVQAAREYPDVEFCHATGTMAHTEGLENYHNAFASIYEGRYLCGVVLGMKLNEMIETGEITEEEAKCSYIGAYDYSEVVSGMTAEFLGVRSMCPSATMDVIFTNSWYDPTAEGEAGINLVSNGAKVLAGHADSNGIGNACLETNTPFAFYNGSVKDIYPDQYMIATKVNWEPYFNYMIQCVATGEAIDTDWCGSLADGSVEMLEINEKAVPEGAAAKVEEIKQKLINGEIQVFDTNTFTVNGEKLESYMADVNSDENYKPDTEAIANGYFHESEYRSAPYFNIFIDGITVLTGGEE